MKVFKQLPKKKEVEKKSISNQIRVIPNQIPRNIKNKNDPKTNSKQKNVKKQNSSEEHKLEKNEEFLHVLNRLKKKNEVSSFDLKDDVNKFNDISILNSNLLLNQISDEIKNRFDEKNFQKNENTKVLQLISKKKSPENLKNNKIRIEKIISKNKENSYNTNNSKIGKLS